MNIISNENKVKNYIFITLLCFIMINFFVGCASANELTNRNYYVFPNSQGLGLLNYMPLTSPQLQFRTTGGYYNSASMDSKGDGILIPSGKINCSAFITSDVKFDIAHNDFKIGYIVDSTGGSTAAPNYGTAFIMHNHPFNDYQPNKNNDRAHLAIYKNEYSTQISDFINNAIAVELDNSMNHTLAYQYLEGKADGSVEDSDTYAHFAITRPDFATSTNCIRHLERKTIPQMGGGTSWQWSEKTRIVVEWKLTDPGSTDQLEDNIYTMTVRTYMLDSNMNQLYNNGVRVEGMISHKFTYADLIYYFASNEVYLGFSASSEALSVPRKISLDSGTPYYLKHEYIDNTQDYKYIPTKEYEEERYYYEDEYLNIEPYIEKFGDYLYRWTLAFKSSDGTQTRVADIKRFQVGGGNILPYLGAIYEFKRIRYDWQVKEINLGKSIQGRNDDPGIEIRYRNDSDGKNVIDRIIYKYAIGSSDVPIKSDDILKLLKAQSNYPIYSNDLNGIEKEKSLLNIDGYSFDSTNSSYFFTSSIGLKHSNCIMDIVDKNNSYLGENTIYFANYPSGVSNLTGQYDMTGTMKASDGDGLVDYSKFGNININPLSPIAENDISQGPVIDKMVDGTQVNWELYARSKTVNKISLDGNHNADSLKNMIGITVVGVDVTKPTINSTLTRTQMGINNPDLIDVSRDDFIKSIDLDDKIVGFDNHTKSNELVNKKLIYKVDGLNVSKSDLKAKMWDGALHTYSIYGSISDKARNISDETKLMTYTPKIIENPDQSIIENPDFVTVTFDANDYNNGKADEFTIARLTSNMSGSSLKDQETISYAISKNMTWKDFISYIRPPSVEMKNNKWVLLYSDQQAYTENQWNTNRENTGYKIPSADDTRTLENMASTTNNKLSYYAQYEVPLPLGKKLEEKSSTMILIIGLLGIITMIVYNFMNLRR